MRRLLLFLVSLAMPISAQTPALPYRDASLPVDARVRDLLGRMTPQEKFWQLYMSPGDLDDPASDYSSGAFGLQISTAPTDANVARAHAERINAIQHYFVERTRLGIPIIPFEEALHGLVRGGATAFPQAIGLAATWDTALVGRVAQAIADETRSRGIRQVLSPVLNLATDARWGRVEETYGEDPVLASQMGVAFVSALEQAGVIATPKHLVANVGDGGRDSYPIDVSQRLLEELYEPPFRAAIMIAHAHSIMSAYNSVDGLPASQNRALLTDLVKRDWRLDGFVISDAAAVGGATVLHHTEASTATATKHALESGLDVIFQSTWAQHRPYLEAFRTAGISPAVIDSAVARVLRAKFQLGLFEHPYVDPDNAARENLSAAHHALAREAARASIVLLRNEHAALPLASHPRSIAVLGVDAAEARLGGYSRPGPAAVSILAGLRERAATVRYAPGPGRVSPEYMSVPATQFTHADSGRVLPGLRGEYFANTQLDGAPTFVRIDERIDFGWTLNAPGRGLPFDWYSVRWTGRVAAPGNARARLTRIGVEGNDGYRLYLDGKLVIDNWLKRSYGTHVIPVAWTPGSVHDVRLEYFESTGNARVKLVWDAGVPRDWSARIAAAVDSARRSDVAVIVAGLEEGEFRDRAFLSLPGHQETLIERVAATGTPTVVVLVGGSAVAMSTASRWMDRVGAIVDAWYPGDEGGRAVADVLFGDYDPAGRLPITFAMSEGQLPLVYNHKPTGRGDDYLDLTGQPLFPFGFGLSYTTFAYSNLSITPATMRPTDSATVRLRVQNTGSRAGDEVVQLYLRDILASVARPVEQLAAFTRIHLAPGEARDVAFQLSREQLQLLDEQHEWVVEPGVFRVLVGSSSRDIRLRGDLRVTN